VYDIGYQIGDVVHQKLNITLPKGYQLDESSLPKVGKGNVNVELRKYSRQITNLDQKSNYTLDLEWQIFRVMLETRAYPLRPLNLRFNRTDQASKQLDKSLSVRVKPPKVLVSSVLPTTMDAKYIKLRKDILPKARDVANVLTYLAFSFAVLICTIFYFAWHYDWIPNCIKGLFSEPKPYKKAYRKILALQRGSETQAKLKEAICNFRRACDEAAGVVITEEKIDTLFINNDCLLKHKADIQAFYKKSDIFLFSRQTVSTDLNISNILKLSRQLMLLESR